MTEPLLPVEFVSRLHQIIPDEDKYQAVIDALSRERPTTFRVNTLKANAEELRSSLTAKGFVLEPVPWYDGAFTLTHGDLRALTETPEYTDGRLYVQSLSSMLPPLILEPKPGDKVLDITAAPGSKTTQMAALMKNEGAVANDTSRERIYRLIGNLKIQGVTNGKLTNSDARSLWQTYPEYFDKTLVDVPCSMEGRFHSGDPKTYADWTLKKVKDLSHLQRWILRSAVSATKKGGTIVYSTCTLSPEENEEIVDWILKKEKGNVVLEDIPIDNFSFDPVVRHWGTHTFDASIERTGRVYPTGTMEGFYIARFKKVKSSVPKATIGYNKDKTGRRWPNDHGPRK